MVADVPSPASESAHERLEALRVLRKPPKWTWKRIRIGQEEVELLQADFPRRHEFHTVLKRSEGLRLLTCMSEADAESRCREVLESLATGAWRVGPALGSVAPMRQAVLGRVMDVPADCRLKQRGQNGGYTCTEQMTAAWLVVPDQTRADRLASEFEKQLWDGMRERGAPVKRDSIPCVLAGTAVTCRRIRLDHGEGPDTLITLTATVRKGNQVLVAMCDTIHDTGDEIPCSLVFDLK